MPKLEENYLRMEVTRGEGVDLRAVKGVPIGFD